MAATSNPFSNETRIHIEDALKHLYKCERDQRRPTLQSLAGALGINPDAVAQLLSRMQTHQLLQAAGHSFELTDSGREYALQVIRAHRLWERYLADETGYAEAEWHNRAERAEHHLTADEAAALAARLGNPTHDPHGDPIPTPEGTIQPKRGQPLTTFAAGQYGRIVHLEDEPPVVYAQLVAERLVPGLAVHILESTPERIRFQANGSEHTLAPLIAANISLVPLAEIPPQTLQSHHRLSDLQPGQSARVQQISPRCRGAERRRLMDLGLMPGTVVAAELRSPGGDPTAYRIRGALIALRHEQADLIDIHPFNPEASSV